MTLTPEQIAGLRRGLLPNSAFLTSYEVGIALLSALAAIIRAKIAETTHE